MNIDFNHPIINLDGEQFQDKPTLLALFKMTLLSQLPGDERMDISAKVKLFDLYEKVKGGGIVDMSVEELSTIKDRIGKAPFLSIVAVARAARVLDGKTDQAVASQAEHDRAADEADRPSGAPAPLIEG